MSEFTQKQVANEKQKGEKKMMLPATALTNEISFTDRISKGFNRTPQIGSLVPSLSNHMMKTSNLEIDNELLIGKTIVEEPVMQTDGEE